MKLNDVIVVESDDGVLHEMVVRSIDADSRTVTGEVANWKPRLNKGGKVVTVVAVPYHAIREVG